MPAAIRPRPPRRPKPRAQAALAPAPAPDPLDFQTASLGYALRRAQMRAYELFYAQLAEQGLSPARLTALSIVAMEAPAIDQATLAQRLQISGPSVVKLVDTLEDAGLLARGSDPADRRRCVLALTAAGRERLAAVRAATPGYEDALAAGLSAGERATLLALLQRVAGLTPG